MKLYNTNETLKCSYAPKSLASWKNCLSRSKGLDVCELHIDSKSLRNHY